MKADSGWAMETSLDIEWAHAIAPKAKILLVEATTPSGANLFRRGLCRETDWSFGNINVVGWWRIPRRNNDGFSFCFEIRCAIFCIVWRRRHGSSLGRHHRQML